MGYSLGGNNMLAYKQYRFEVAVLGKRIIDAVIFADSTEKARIYARSQYPNAIFISPPCEVTKAPRMDAQEKDSQKARKSDG